MHLLSLPQKCIQSVSKKKLIVHGDGQESWKSSKKEEIILLFFPMMALMQTDKVLVFVQQFDVAFGGEHFTEHSKLCHVAMHFQKSSRQWWVSLRTQRIAPRTWKECHQEIMNQILTDQTKDDVLTA